MLPKPQSRLEVLLNKIATNTMNDLPIPQSRLELLVSSLITNDIDNLPSPQSRSEAILHCILLDTECNISPQSRVELFLKSIITLDIEGLPTPMSRLEWYLDYIVRNGCLEKYEYYPFSIWNYLNVKNTPNAKMKFKSMKGNTLVNLARAVNLTIDDKSPTTNNIPFNSVQGFQSGKKYTIVCKFEGYKGTKPIKFRQRKYDTSWNYEFNTLIKDFSDGIKIAVYTPTQDFKDVALYLDYVDEKDTSVSISDVIILEGDYTQNPPNGYIEGMQSFGDDANKIEVLSDNNLQGELKQSSKATLMYHNANNELVPVPVLRGKWEGDRFLWGDEILLHEDGKLYYHKRYDKCIFDGSENWEYEGVSSSTIVFRVEVTEMKKYSNNLLCDKFEPNLQGEVEKIASALRDNGVMALFIRINKSKLETQDVAGFKKWLQSNNVTVIYQLAKEEVYPCELSGQLYSFDNETNIFINGGAVVGETVIEVGTKLGPIVATLKQETKTVTDGLKGVLAGDMQELAYQLYPDDFNKDIVEIKPIESV